MITALDIITTTRLLLECILKFNHNNTSIINQEYIELRQRLSLLVVIQTDHTVITAKITVIISKITDIMSKITAIISKIMGIITVITAKITAIMGKITGFLALFSAKITAIIAEITAIIPIKDSIKAQEKPVLTAIIAA